MAWSVESASAPGNAVAMSLTDSSDPGGAGLAAGTTPHVDAGAGSPGSGDVADSAVSGVGVDAPSGGIGAQTTVGPAVAVGSPLSEGTAVADGSGVEGEV
ncbi:MAG TPA: hypothetical protein VHJ83_13695, partial [Micromonosporaceae bacterium]|nr:hypothetical protein [Micromonosporaceae bacterium]